MSRWLILSFFHYWFLYVSFYFVWLLFINRESNPFKKFSVEITSTFYFHQLLPRYPPKYKCGLGIRNSLLPLLISFLVTHPCIPNSPFKPLSINKRYRRFSNLNLFPFLCCINEEEYINFQIEKQGYLKVWIGDVIL